MRVINLLALLLIALTLVAAQPEPTIAAQAKPTIPDVDRFRLAEAFRLADALSDRIWSNWSKAPFAVLLVTQDHEFLVRHPKPTDDFSLIGYDALLKSNVYFRKRTLSLKLLATFPAVGGVSTIVVGQAENTQAKTSTPWVVTLLHEHFHQLQDSQPDSYAAVNALNLSRGDQTGMWMLNYSFPYERPDVTRQFSVLTKSLAAAVEATDRKEFSSRLTEYLVLRRQLQQVLSDDDYKYLSFQLWKEGIARYTEYRVALAASQGYKPGKSFGELKDFRPYSDVARSIKKLILSELVSLKIEDDKRVLFYPIGAAEGLLLDRRKPNWHQRYFADKFYLEKYF